MDQLFNIDLWTCVTSGIVIGVTSICVSSFLPDMSQMMGNEEEIDVDRSTTAVAGKKDVDVNPRSDGAPAADDSATFTEEEVYAFVAEKMCDKLIRHVPNSVMSEMEIRAAVKEASTMKDDTALTDEDVNIFVILSWLLFLCVIVVSYYLADAASGGQVTEVLRGIFPREFAFFHKGSSNLRNMLAAWDL